jgi:hypothetical protein
MRRCARKDSNLRLTVRSQPRPAPIDLRRAPRPAVERIFLVGSEVQSAGTTANPPVVVVGEVVNIGADSAIVQAAVRELCGTYLALSAKLGLSQELGKESDLTVATLLDNLFV